MPWFRKHTEEAPTGSRTLTLTGVTLVAAGLALMSPGFKDALLSAVNKAFDLGLSLDAPWWTGVPLVAAGVWLLVPLFVRQLRDARRPDEPARAFLALRHVSLDLSLPPKLEEVSIPGWLGRRYLRHADCDQTRCLSLGATKLTRALSIQEDAFNEITVQRRNDDRLAVGYYGVAHVPLQILAGHTATTAVRAALFELDRPNSTWRELAQGKGSNLGVRMQPSPSAEPPVSAVIRVAVSYGIPLADVSEVVSGPFDEFLITVAEPKRDIITHYGQVEAIADAFRDALDSALGRVPKGGIIHVFAAVPMCVGFSLGRMITKTLHPEVVAYNYSAQSTPRYAWGIRINVNDLGRRQVVRPQQAGIPELDDEAAE
ncbi:SAVED domain-containing protein [Roseomonas aerophila]|uniref:SAVED domain-containing protein n=1 Tax=Teichococcus aerophilus TaxID=1224513 RepID=A0ABR7RLS5_9PROT|nr:SAVED domain-containing protein [Pseudoroseomonas aerophila]MBC9207085.1 SAVED domain-containing protein [Pseudoroseomonas aerophila]